MIYPHVSVVKLRQTLGVDSCEVCAALALAVSDGGY